MTYSRSAVAAKVAAEKSEHPERFCPTRRCLWRTGDGSYCPRHAPPKPTEPVTTWNGIEESYDIED